MNSDLMQNQKWIEQKAKLQFVEEKILRITDINGWVGTKDLYEQVKDLLCDRHYILNQMFRMHITDQETERFHEVNWHLSELSQDLFSEHRKTVEFFSVNYFDGVTLCCSVEVESLLVVDADGSLLLFKEDADYGSDFSKMADIIAWTEDLEIRSCSTNIYEKPESDHLDDGTTWAEGCLDLPQFKDIVVCYAVHDLCTHKNYTVPDLLRLNTFSISHRIVTDHSRNV